MKSQPLTPVALVKLTLILSETAVSRFFPLLGQGFLVTGPGNETVESFLQKAASVSPAYLEDRVQTIFLNGNALDNFKTVMVADGATLALSAAMPGLAGAVLRRGGFYAAMRRQITHEAGGPAAGGQEITITLKLFNLVARDLGPRLLASGIRISGGQLRDFIERQGGWMRIECVAAEADGKPIGAKDLAGAVPPTGQVLLIVSAQVR
jgi:hypothetical protein